MARTQVGATSDRLSGIESDGEHLCRSWANGVAVEGDDVYIEI
jgi:hypothetical protein